MEQKLTALLTLIYLTLIYIEKRGGLIGGQRLGLIGGEPWPRFGAQLLARLDHEAAGLNQTPKGGAGGLAQLQGIAQPQVAALATQGGKNFLLAGGEVGGQGVATDQGNRLTLLSSRRLGRGQIRLGPAQLNQLLHGAITVAALLQVGPGVVPRGGALEII